MPHARYVVEEKFIRPDLTGSVTPTKSTSTVILAGSIITMGCTHSKQSRTHKGGYSAPVRKQRIAANKDIDPKDAGSAADVIADTVITESAASRVFAIPELLEMILIEYCLEHQLPYNLSESFKEQDETDRSEDGLPIIKQWIKYEDDTDYSEDTIHKMPRRLRTPFPVLALFSLQRVNKSFAAIIQNTPSLQRFRDSSGRMFYTAAWVVAAPFYGTQLPED